ncbi:5-oxoprolinase subunit PxpB [Oceanimonas baumannii]|uniref:5-oxoprolinase subunit PxpB n=1 Tax=Oceanimonas baumannii TaxID=129578 RepID=UPI001D182FE6|nr:5-oxoprolinase subunit PxpB [Oceanimonas baumannii]MCC4264401.1 5-oxoprolinase subunit PxpB [Oceanimonas baumannii]
MNPRLENAGLDAWLVRLFDDIDEANMNWISALVQDCERAFGAHLTDLVPSYTTLLVQFDPFTLDHGEARRLLQTLLARLTPLEDNTQDEVKALPVWYHPSVGPDLARLEQHTGLSTERIIELHSGHTYRVFALGFAPGFAFMGTLPAALETPRHNSPRPRVPAGSVALAGRQTSAYPNTTPGGWNLLGRTPARLFNPASQNLSLLRVGNRVRFEPISQGEFERLGGDTTSMEA